MYEFVSESLRGARVLVTGASTGIGEQIAYHYARFGARVVITARREKVLQQVSELDNMYCEWSIALFILYINVCLRCSHVCGLSCACVIWSPGEGWLWHVWTEPNTLRLVAVLDFYGMITVAENVTVTVGWAGSWRVFAERVCPWRCHRIR